MPSFCFPLAGECNVCCHVFKRTNLIKALASTSSIHTKRQQMPLVPFVHCTAKMRSRALFSRLPSSSAAAKGRGRFPLFSPSRREEMTFCGDVFSHQRGKRPQPGPPPFSLFSFTQRCFFLYARSKNHSRKKLEKENMKEKLGALRTTTRKYCLYFPGSLRA